MEALSARSAWPIERVEEFLATYRAPLRLAVQAESGFPLLCSLWFIYEGERLLCATQRDAAVVRNLERDARCGFELAPNEPPYFGVRGRGLASIETDGADVLLGRLIERYLGEEETKLGSWLLGRAEQEVVVSIELAWITSWDYSDRMGS